MRGRDQLQDAVAVLEQALSCVGQFDSASVTQQQDFAKLRLQCANLAAQRGLSDVQHDSRLAEAAQFGHVNEVLDLLQIHEYHRAMSYAVLL